jgi:hypothetical protein
MKEIKQKSEVFNTLYEAIDGTVFNSREECEKYELTAKCIIQSKVMSLIVSKDNDAWELLGGLDDHTITAFKMQKIEDVDAMKQFFLIECPWYQSDERAEQREQKFKIIDKAFINEDVILFGQNCDGDYYFINSRQNIINNLNNLDKKDNA